MFYILFLSIALFFRHTCMAIQPCLDPKIYTTVGPIGILVILSFRSKPIAMVGMSISRNGVHFAIYRLLLSFSVKENPFRP